MFCYRDMTFCPYFDSCRFGDVCHRALTDGVREAAELASGGEVMDWDANSFMYGFLFGIAFVVLIWTIHDSVTRP